MSTDPIILGLAVIGVCTLGAGVGAGVWWLGEWAKRAIRRRMWRKHGGHR
jgi:membrane protein DedA with SNARE-associated domain